MKTTYRIAAALSLALLLVGGVAGAAKAFDFRSGDTITIASSETVDDDLFASAGRVVVDGTVNGDLFAMGGQVEINGTVNGSLFVGGQTIEVNGTVTGSVYGGGMSVTLGPSASVGRNALFGGFGFEAKPGSTIERDLLVGGYQGILGGEVRRDVRFGGSALELNGTVGGDVTADVEAPAANAPAMPMFAPGMPPPIAPGLRVSDGAVIGGKLTYTSPVEQTSAIQSQPEGGVAFQTPMPDAEAEPPPRANLAFNILGWIFDRVREFVTLLFLGAIAVWKLPSVLNSLIEQARTKPLPSAGWGLVVVIVGYAGAVIVGALVLVVGILFGIITLGGLSETVFGVGFSSIGVVMAVFTLLVSYGSKLVIACLVGQLIVKAVAPQSSANNWLALLIGVVVYVFLRSIPLLGWVIGVLATITGIGAMWLLFRQWRRPALAPATP